MQMSCVIRHLCASAPATLELPLEHGRQAHDKKKKKQFSIHFALIGEQKQPYEHLSVHGE